MACRSARACAAHIAYAVQKCQRRCGKGPTPGAYRWPFVHRSMLPPPRHRDGAQVRLAYLSGAWLGVQRRPVRGVERATAEDIEGGACAPLTPLATAHAPHLHGDRAPICTAHRAHPCCIWRPGRPLPTASRAPMGRPPPAEWTLCVRVGFAYRARGMPVASRVGHGFFARTAPLNLR